MERQPDYLVYLGTLLRCLPPGRESQATFRKICSRHELTLQHIVQSSDDVFTKEKQIEQARTSFVATLHGLCDTELPDVPAPTQPDLPPIPELDCLPEIPPLTEGNNDGPV